MKLITNINQKGEADIFGDDIFALGWREVWRTKPDGETYFERIPLTLEDILHPQEEDFRRHNRFHDRSCRYLADVFESQVKHDPQAVVLHDVRVAWALSRIRPHGPDVCVIFNVQEIDDWSTFDETKEYTKPSLIVEVTSPSTRTVDLQTKVTHYAQVGVPYYFIVDSYRDKKQTRQRILGYHLQNNVYITLQPNARGWFWLPPLQIWLGLEQNEVCCYDQQEQAIGGYVDIQDQLMQAEVRAGLAEEQVEVAEEQLQQAEVRAEMAQEQAQAAQEQAQAAEAKAMAETLARQQVETQMQEMMTELQRLRGK